MHVAMKQLKEFDIQFVGLKLGEHRFEYKINKTFFEAFEYDEFNDANVNVSVTLNKKTTLLELHYSAKGSVNINCDLTNERYDQKIKNSFDVVVKFGDAYNDENEDILILPHGSYEMNISQYIYELIALAVPLKRIHPGVLDGTLNSDILEKLKELSPKENDIKADNQDIDPRWATLKKLLTDK